VVHRKGEPVKKYILALLFLPILVNAQQGFPSGIKTSDIYAFRNGLITIHDSVQLLVPFSQSYISHLQDSLNTRFRYSDTTAFLTKVLKNADSTTERNYSTYLYSLKAGSSSIVTVGTLTSGAIGSGFTLIDTSHTAAKVRKIVQGTNITISPASGVGDVTISATGSGGLVTAGGWTTFGGGRVYTTNSGDTVNVRSGAADTTGGKGRLNVYGGLYATGNAIINGTVNTFTLNNGSALDTVEYAAKFLKNADSTTERNYSNALYLSKTTFSNTVGLDSTSWNTAATRAALIVADTAKWNAGSPALGDTVLWNIAYTRSGLLVADSSKWNTAYTRSGLFAADSAYWNAKQNAIANLGDTALYKKNSDSVVVHHTTFPVPIIIDSYSESHYALDIYVFAGHGKAAQSFTGNGTSLVEAVFYIHKRGSPTGNIVASLYAHTGTFGSTGTPTGAPLATSNPVDITTLSSSTYALIPFTFPSPYTVAAGTHYFISIEYADAGSYISNSLEVGVDSPSPTAPGNFSGYASSWTADASMDICFYVYSGFVTDSVEYSGYTSLFQNTFNLKDSTFSNTVGRDSTGWNTAVSQAASWIADSSIMPFLNKPNTFTQTQTVNNVSGIGISVNSNTDVGLYATSSGGYGVYGSSSVDIGVYGTSTASYGVYGSSSVVPGVFGTSTASYGVYGFSTAGYGVVGQQYGGAYPRYGVFSYGSSYTQDTLRVGKRIEIGKAIIAGINSSVLGDYSASIGAQDTLKGQQNYSMGYYNVSDATYNSGFGNWLFGQYLHTTGKGVWAFGSDDSFTKHIIPFCNSIVFYGEPVMNWSSTGLGVGSTRLSTSYQSIQSRDSIRYGQYYTIRAGGGYASFDIGSQRQFSINGSSGNLDNAYSHTYLSFNYDSLQGIYFNPTKTDAQPYGNVVIQNGNFSVLNGTSSFTANNSSLTLGSAAVVGSNAYTQLTLVSPTTSGTYGNAANGYIYVAPYVPTYAYRSKMSFIVAGDAASGNGQAGWAFRNNQSSILGSGTDRDVFTVDAYTGNATFAGTINSGAITSSATIKLGSYIVSGLPSASTSGAGAMAYVTDALLTPAAGLGIAVTGLGGYKAMVISDGVSWIEQ
jgi:hypothetical protein